MFLPSNPKEFNQKVWEIVRKIPRGKVTSFGRIAAMIATPNGMTLKEYEGVGARWVGSAMAQCPDDVPWQRVINSQGKISIRKNSDGHLLQKKLLEDEGIEFDLKDRIDLSRYGWNADQPTLGI
ncbi:MAG: MGMT family protein [Chloroflexi bacterium]|nr:MGMT family protein [Chloroflexota bacterium]